jgi:O-6-methylguanine DNA methyltransferase
MASSANPPIHVAIGASSLGSVLVAASDRGICSILLGADREVLLRDLKDRFPEARLVEDPSLDHLMAKVVDLIETPAQTFDLPLDPRGTDFEMRVWQALREIPAGSTASYSEIAQRIGAPKEAYAVGEACAANMIAVAIPCHRVVRKDGTLAGYRWGFTRKRALLEREKASFATRSGKPPYRILSIRKAVVALAAVLMASALPAAAQQSRAETDSPLAEIRTTLRAFYFNLGIRTGKPWPLTSCPRRWSPIAPLPRPWWQRPPGPRLRRVRSWRARRTPRHSSIRPQSRSTAIGPRCRCPVVPSRPARRTSSASSASKRVGELSTSTSPASRIRFSLRGSGLPRASRAGSTMSLHARAAAVSTGHVWPLSQLPRPPAKSRSLSLASGNTCGRRRSSLRPR